MKQYKFLLKPVFFVFNLIFATWLVLKIEQIKPSDFGEHRSIFEPAPKPRIVTPEDKEFLRGLAFELKYGLIDSLTVEKKLDEFLAPPKDPELEEKLGETMEAGM